MALFQASRASGRGRPALSRPSWGSPDLALIAQDRRQERLIRHLGGARRQRPPRRAAGFGWRPGPGYRSCRAGLPDGRGPRRRPDRSPPIAGGPPPRTGTPPGRGRPRARSPLGPGKFYRYRPVAESGPRPSPAPAESAAPPGPRPAGGGSSGLTPSGLPVIPSPSRC